MRRTQWVAPNHCLLNVVSNYRKCYNRCALQPFRCSLIRMASSAGLLNAFQTVSIAARPLINVHDLAVVPAFRGQGIGTLVITAMEQIAQERDCCKLTLEVLSGNQTAQQTLSAF